MATRQQLETALVNADAAGDTQAAQMLANAIRQGQYEETPTGAATIGQQIRDIPGANEVLELVSGFNRGIAQIADTVGTDTVNAVLRLTGSQTQLPRLSEEIPGIAGGYVEPGLTQQVLGAAGETAGAGLVGGQALRAATAGLPAATGTEGVITGALRQLGQARPAADVALGAAAGAGAEIGEEIGEKFGGETTRGTAGDVGAVVGGILAPVTAQAATQSLKFLVGLGRRGIERFLGITQNMSDEGAATLLAEAMVRENLTPDDVIKRMNELGPEAIPADLGANFGSLLRVAANQVPRIRGRVAQVTQARQEGQAARIIDAFDDAGGTSTLDVNDEIVRLNMLLKPQIEKAYAEAYKAGFKTSPKLANILENNIDAASAFKTAEQTLVNKATLGDEITPIQLLDETKRALDDRIGKSMRQGKLNKARDLVRVKNEILADADAANKRYSEARHLFAGKKDMENAAELGKNFFNLKVRDVDAFTESMGDAEKKLFRLGAKQAILDRAETMDVTADKVKRLFGKGGSVGKLRGVFPDNDAYERFADNMEREATFILTRRAAQANSTTAMQLADAKNANQAITAAQDVLLDPTAGTLAFRRVSKGFLEKRRSEAYARSLEQAGDILLASGMQPEKLVTIIKRGNKEQVLAELKKVLNVRAIERRAASARAVAAEQVPEQQE